MLITNVKVYAEDKIIENGFIEFEDTKIKRIGSIDELEQIDNENVIKLDNHYSLIPGMIDLHIHGAAGADAMDATPDALRTIAQALPKEGTTSFLATTMTKSREDIYEAIKNIGEYIPSQQNGGIAEILGAHLEGPFLSPKRAGAQHPDNIIEPDVELFKQWQQLSGNNIRLVTLAPEEKGGLELTTYLKETGVVASIGHSDAVYEEVEASIQAGVTHATHLFNGMRGVHHREPGVAGAVLLHDEVKCEMIVDGIHIAPKMVKLAYKVKGNDGVILVTDAMRAKCLGTGVYDLGGQEVNVDEERATLKDGTLAGSILKLNDAVRNMMQFSECTLWDITQMTAANPAKQINMFDKKGSIKVGKDADFVIVNEKLEVIMTYCCGKLAYSSQEEM
ncbi:N-acetylglucosamine-6-phosphate deacetylase [Fredinandcohnia quinoae]|uniref:N-acetylglucosamine-6-phosphate deacetylase n=1 Tax=Fredinandcohnia quinoae TaxID=2918902 RepID=A0AAW5E7R0_9BACI|nr:N-acetylglucosamine-6-phosphate deacetylase [Fredinandcohnia sp. SECRCQ15]MCH1627275.1 N-acetylglucosamine-6-phosphate deacetylase [Fredinandcohnia sp. SECRCQ15]